MLQLKQHLFRAFFFLQKMTSCALYYDVIYHPLPINSQYLKKWGGGGVTASPAPVNHHFITVCYLIL